MLKTLENWNLSLKSKYGWVAAAIGSLLAALWWIDEKLLDNRVSKTLGSLIIDLWSYTTSSQPVPGYVLGLVSLAASLAAISLVFWTLRKIEFYTNEIGRLTKQLNLDSRTNIPNRRKLEAAFPNYKKDLAERNFCVCYMDIVDFKKINEKINHEPANLVLKRFAERVKGVLRPEDDLFRLEGDQFALLLAGTNVDGARICARRITESLRNENFHGGIDIKTGRSIDVDVRCRFGITDGTEEDKLEDCLDRADSALNLAKKYDASNGDGESAIRIVTRGDARQTNRYNPQLSSSSTPIV
jgi:diguanylate cyclase (GGDEF)-like protein